MPYTLPVNEHFYEKYDPSHESQDDTGQQYENAQINWYRERHLGCLFYTHQSIPDYLIVDKNESLSQENAHK